MANGKWAALYDWRWRRYAKDFIKANPLCVACKARGYITASSICDHKIPHRGDPSLFNDPGNHQALCKPCHDGPKQRQDKGGSGLSRGADINGNPVDPTHPWHRATR